jgi:uncharacterized membrane protein
MKPPYAALVVLALAACAIAEQEPAVIQGYVRDGNSGKSLAGVKVDVYPSSDHTNLAASGSTGENGFYNLTVPSGSYYDVYLRMGDTNPNQRTTEAVVGGATYPINFNIAVESNYQSAVMEKYGMGVVLIVAALIVAVILVDQLALRRKTKGPGMEELKRQRDQLEGMVSLAKAKYHRREIDEESFREITRDQQEKLIELESKIKALEGK